MVFFFFFLSFFARTCAFVNNATMRTAESLFSPLSFLFPLSFLPPFSLFST